MFIWWLLGFPFPFGSAWAVAPLFLVLPVTLASVVVLATVVIGLYGGLIWARQNL
jgi:hypothetical protein